MSLFTRARLRLTLLYAGLLGLTLLLVLGVVAVRAVHEAHEMQDEGLRVQAEDLADQVRRAGVASVAPSDGGLLSSGEDAGHVEAEGIISYVLTVQDGRVQPPIQGGADGLPDLAAAQAALAAPRFSAAEVGSAKQDVRVYGVPVRRAGGVVAVVQVARSQDFVDRTVTRLVLLALVAGAAGLVISTAAGFWVAGLTLRPIAVALDRQRAFAADASHELRTPLSVVLGNAEYLVRHPREPIGAHLEAVQDIVDEGRRLTRLVADLLTLARADEGALEFAHGDVDLSALAATLARRFAAARVVEDAAVVNTEIAPGVHVRGDADRLHELGVILLDNAVRYAPGTEITVRVAGDNGSALLAVSDAGAGIPPEHLPHLFERFYRVDDARSQEDGGAGLGLAIAQWIAERHGGRIDVSSDLGHGTTFTLRLPRTAR